MMRTEQTLYSDLAIPPGEYLEEVLDEFGLSCEEFVQQLDCSGTELVRIHQRDVPITSKMALQFEKILGVPTHIWNGLEDEYRTVVSRGQGK